MQTQRSFDPNDRITFSLTVAQYNTLTHQLRRAIPVVMYDELHPVILELSLQLQKFIQEPTKPTSEADVIVMPTHPAAE